MEYVSQVIDEALQFVNISFVSFRQAAKDVFVNGYLIPKGWKAQLWYRSVHMDPEVYPDPKKFNPSRWEGPPSRAETFIPLGLWRPDPSFTREVLQDLPGSPPGSPRRSRGSLGQSSKTSQEVQPDLLEVQGTSPKKS